MLTRRQLIQKTAFSVAALSTPGVFAEQLARTARQTEGPFYPDRLPLDTDNDLLVINDSITPAVGQVTHLTGRVLSVTGEPIRNATVEIWQADSNGIYIHSRGGNRNKLDGNFQGFGRFMTNGKGEYYFRTIKPVQYGGRPSHIHMAVLKGSSRMLTTQVYTKGDSRNRTDRILNSVPRKAQEMLIAEYKKIPDSMTNELAVNFDVVIGATPEDPDHDVGRQRPPRGGMRRR